MAFEPESNDIYWRLKLTSVVVLTLLLMMFVASPSNASEPSMSTAAATNPPTATSQVSFHTIAKGYRSGIVEPTQVVVRTQAEWIALWQKHAAAEANPSPAPSIDFSKNIVAGIFLGQKPTGGYDVEIVRVDRDEGTLTILFREKSPRPGAILTQAFTQPFHIVSISIEGTPAVHFRRTP